MFPPECGVANLLALQWRDIDWHQRTLTIYKSIWHQHLGPVKTEESEKVLPLDEEMLADLIRWRKQTPYAGEEDWIFASPRMHGKQPLWPESVMKNHIRPAAKRAGITKHVTWHAFRHSFSTLLVANGNDVKTVQHLLLHANPSVTLGLYTGAVDEKSRKAQTQIVQQMLGRSAAEGGGRGKCLTRKTLTCVP